MKKIYGIDSLYFFFESNENYDDLYLEILDQMEDIKGVFRKKELKFEKKDIHIKINDITLQYLGKKEGFYFFKESQHALFRIGFKNNKENRSLNDIRVQLQGDGIYTLGINSIIELLKNMLNGYITNFIPVTRADINCFIQHDFSFVKKDMFVTRKRKYSTINEIGNANSTQTIYIGKEPFKLRLYNKSLELKKSKKFELMNEYFLNNGFNLEEPIFNIEFQMHRTHLRQYEISSIDELLSNAKNLFQLAMDDIRLIDINSVSKSVLEHNKHEALTHPIWEEIKNNFSLDGFLQDALPLERLKRKVSIYDSQKFEDEYLTLLRKAYTNKITLDEDYIVELLKKAKESLRKHKSKAEYRQRFTLVEVEHSDGTKEELRLLEDGKLIKPLQTQTVSILQDYDLMLYLDQVTETQHISERHFHIFQVAQKEAIKRGLMPTINLSEVADECPNF